MVWFQWFEQIRPWLGFLELFCAREGWLSRGFWYWLLTRTAAGTPGSRRLIALPLPFAKLSKLSVVGPTFFWLGRFMAKMPHPPGEFVYLGEHGISANARTVGSQSWMVKFHLQIKEQSWTFIIVVLYIPSINHPCPIIESYTIILKGIPKIPLYKCENVWNEIIWSQGTFTWAQNHSKRW